MLQWSVSEKKFFEIENFMFAIHFSLLLLDAAREMKIQTQAAYKSTVGIQIPNIFDLVNKLLKVFFFFNVDPHCVKSLFLITSDLYFFISHTCYKHTITNWIQIYYFIIQVMILKKDHIMSKLNTII